MMLEALPDAAASWVEFLRALRQICDYGYDPFVFNANGHVKPTTLEQVRVSGGAGSRNILLVRHGVIA
ncbi:MAG: hypothetical protein M0Z50_01420 [Planctomycetia bacterium]|nr:hypothetical protein [Planctomycetia bacterium]